MKIEPAKVWHRTRPDLGEGTVLKAEKSDLHNLYRVRWTKLAPNGSPIWGYYLEDELVRLDVTGKETPS